LPWKSFSKYAIKWMNWDTFSFFFGNNCFIICLIPTYASYICAYAPGSPLTSVLYKLLTYLYLLKYDCSTFQTPLCLTWSDRPSTKFWLRPCLSDVFTRILVSCMTSKPVVSSRCILRLVFLIFTHRRKFGRNYVHLRSEILCCKLSVI